MKRRILGLYIGMNIPIGDKGIWKRNESRRDNGVNTLWILIYWWNWVYRDWIWQNWVCEKWDCGIWVLWN